VAKDETEARKAKGDTVRANVGGADKVIRVVLGLVIIVLGIVFRSWWGLVGVLVLATGLLNFCWLYIPLGISTRKTAP
jgi:hypothetical protein